MRRPALSTGTTVGQRQPGRRPPEGQRVTWTMAGRPRQAGTVGRRCAEARAPGRPRLLTWAKRPSTLSTMAMPWASGHPALGQGPEQL
eukprot:171419-Alexandrium_andersonii.AAC.1